MHVVSREQAQTFRTLCDQVSRNELSLKDATRVALRSGLPQEAVKALEDLARYGAAKYGAASQATTTRHPLPANNPIAMRAKSNGEAPSEMQIKGFGILKKGIEDGASLGLVFEKAVKFNLTSGQIEELAKIYIEKADIDGEAAKMKGTWDKVKFLARRANDLESIKAFLDKMEA